MEGETKTRSVCCPLSNTTYYGAPFLYDFQKLKVCKYPPRLISEDVFYETCKNPHKKEVTVGFRASEQEEEGLDMSYHGIPAYNDLERFTDIPSDFYDFEESTGISVAPIKKVTNEVV